MLACIVHYILEIRDFKKKKRARKRVKKWVILCVLVTLPVMLGLLVLAVMMSIFSTNLHNNRNAYTLEASSYLQMHCPYPCKGTFVAPIFIGKFSSFWYKSVTITQKHLDPGSSPYSPLHMKVFKMPAHQLRTYNNHYYNHSNRDVIILDFYALKGSTVNFTVFVNSTSFTSSGSVTLTISNNCTQSESVIFTRPLKVGPSELKRFFVKFVAPHNSYYYITTLIGHSNNAEIVSFDFDIHLRFLNASDWTGMEHQSSSTADPLNFRLGDSIFQPRDYIVVANITYVDNVDYRSHSQLRVTKHYRKFVYVVPAMVAGGVMFLGTTCVVLVCVCCYIVRKIIRRKRRGNELYDYSKHID